MSRTPFQFAPPASFSGKKEDFEEFAFKLKAHLALMAVTYLNDLEAIESHPDTEIDDDTFKNTDGTYKQDLVDKATTLQWLLVMLCSGTASVLLRRDVQQNGFESWRKLCKKYKIPSRARAVGRLTRILKPDFTGASFEDRLAQWEEENARYEKETT